MSRGFPKMGTFEYVVTKGGGGVEWKEAEEEQTNNVECLGMVA